MIVRISCRECLHASYVTEYVFSLFSIRVEKDFGVGLAPEDVSLLLKIWSQFSVIDFTS